MIDVNTAKKLITDHVIPLEPITLELRKTAGHVLAGDIYGIFSIPAFRQSSMDGYAIVFGDHQNKLELIGEMAAGATGNLNLVKGQASRIFTGAPLPDGADTVVMQENAIRKNNKVRFTSHSLLQGANVREIGSEIKAGELAMKKGNILNPAALAFLAGIGIHEVPVFPMPKVSVIITGNELQLLGRPLKFGQVYESNSYSLSAALNRENIADITILTASDHLEALSQTLQTALKNSDVVLLTGGVSVGDYDYVITAAENSGVEKIFHRVKQKPGKPLFFGTKKEKLVFGLPGNPSSVLSCYYNYVLPAIKQLSNKAHNIKETEAILAKGYKKPSGLTHFLKGYYANGQATPLGAQESYRLSSFAQANCLICLPETQEEFFEGETVKIILLPD